MVVLAWSAVLADVGTEELELIREFIDPSVARRGDVVRYALRDQMPTGSSPRAEGG